MKSFFKFIGFFFLGILIIILAIVGISSFGSIEAEDTFPPYIQEIVPKLTTWDIEEYKLVMSDQSLESSTPEQWQLYMDLFSKLGQLQSIGEPELQNSRIAFTTDDGNTTYAVYLIPLTFDTGLAHLELGLQYNDGKIQVNRVRFLSDLLLQ